MFPGLGEEERTKFRTKKKQQKKEKPHRSQKWVGRDERDERYLKIYNRVKYFLPYLSRF